MTAWGNGRARPPKTPLELAALITCTRCRGFAFSPEQAPIQVFTPGHYEVQFHHPNCPVAKERKT